MHCLISNLIKIAAYEKRRARCTDKTAAVARHDLPRRDCRGKNYALRDIEILCAGRAATWINWLQVGAQSSCTDRCCDTPADGEKAQWSSFAAVNVDSRFVRNSLVVDSPASTGLSDGDS
jgi:hypothetical protein